MQHPQTHSPSLFFLPFPCLHTRVSTLNHPVHPSHPAYRSNPAPQETPSSASPLRQPSPFLLSPRRHCLLCLRCLSVLNQAQKHNTHPQMLAEAKQTWVRDCHLLHPTFHILLLNIMCIPLLDLIHPVLVIRVLVRFGRSARGDGEWAGESRWCAYRRGC